MTRDEFRKAVFHRDEYRCVICGDPGQDAHHILERRLWPDGGNVILQNGQRMCGELYYDSSVQKILLPVLHKFTSRVKYPRTYHLPWSPGKTKDDRMFEPIM